MPRKQRTIYIKPELLEWVEEQVKKGRFRTFSHVVEVALEKLRLKDETNSYDKHNKNRMNPQTKFNSFNHTVEVALEKQRITTFRHNR